MVDCPAIDIAGSVSTIRLCAEISADSKKAQRSVALRTLSEPDNSMRTWSTCGTRWNASSWRNTRGHVTSVAPIYNPIAAFRDIFVRMPRRFVTEMRLSPIMLLNEDIDTYVRAPMVKTISEVGGQPDRDVDGYGCGVCPDYLGISSTVCPRQYWQGAR